MSRKITAFLLAMLMLPLSAMNTLADENDPDLSINEISFSDDSPTGGDEITITAEVANDVGTSGLITVTTNVSFYYHGNFIAKETITIRGGDTADAETEWTAVGGAHKIKVIVDEEERITESDEDNNEETEDITVSYPPILLLDDDNSGNNGGSRTETDSYYANALDNLTTPIAMSASQAAEQMIEAGIGKNTMVAAAARVGREDQKLWYGKLKYLANKDLGKEPHSVVVPSKLHFTEQDFLESL